MRRNFLAKLARQRIIESASEQQPQWFIDALAALDVTDIAESLWSEMLADVAAGASDAGAVLSIDEAFDVYPQAAVDFLRQYVMEFASGMLADERAGLKLVVMQALETGAGPAQLKHDLRDYFAGGIHSISANGVERAMNLDAWSATVARTELSRAYNQGSRALYIEAGITERVWVAAGEAAECPACEAADGTIAKMGSAFPAVGVEDPPAHPNCCEPGTIIVTQRGEIPIEGVLVGDCVLTYRNRFREVVALSRAEVSEDLIELRVGTSILRVTGNHPVYASDRWTPAASLKPGDKIACVQSKAMLGTPSEPNDIPPERREVLAFGEILAALPGAAMPASPIDLYGEKTIRESDIDTVDTNCIIGNERNPAISQSLADDTFVPGLNSASLSRRHARSNRDGFRLAASSVVGGGCYTNSILDASGGVEYSARSRMASPIQVKTAEASINRGSGVAVLARERLDGFAGDMATVNSEADLVGKSTFRHIVIVSLESVQRVKYTGTVYNFQVHEDESYIANGCVVHNCECTSMASATQIQRYTSPAMVAQRAQTLATNRAWAADHPKRRK